MSPCRDPASVSSFASVALIVSAFFIYFLHFTLFVSADAHASQEMVSFFPAYYAVRSNLIAISNQLSPGA